MFVIPIIDQSNTRSSNVEERKPIRNRCAPEIMQSDAVGDRYRIGIKSRCGDIDALKAYVPTHVILYQLLGRILQKALPALEHKKLL